MTESQSDKAFFEEAGYVALPGFFGKERVARIEEAIDRLVGREPEPGEEMVYYEESVSSPGARILSRIEKFIEVEAELNALVQDERLMAKLAELLDSRPVLFKEKINFKLPGGQGFAPHQDIQPGWDRYAPYFVSVLVTVDPSTLENGCLEIAPGHHRRGWLGKPWEPLTEDDLDGVEFVPIPTEPGDLLIFDCFVPHRSAPNRTPKSRRNLYLTFNREEDGLHRERYFADKRKAFPPDRERDPGATYEFKV